MSQSNMNILVDSCYWIALYDPASDPYLSEKATKIAQDINGQNIIVPYPTLYEFVNSRLGRRETRIEFENFLKRPFVFKLDDSIYRDDALNNFFSKNHYAYSDISFVDEVIKLMIKDPNLRIDYIASFDAGLTSEASSLGIRILS